MKKKFGETRMRALGGSWIHTKRFNLQAIEVCGGDRRCFCNQVATKLRVSMEWVNGWQERWWQPPPFSQISVVLGFLVKSVSMKEVDTENWGWARREGWDSQQERPKRTLDSYKEVKSPEHCSRLGEELKVNLEISEWRRGGIEKIFNMLARQLWPCGSLTERIPADQKLTQRTQKTGTSKW